jgi:hypothetical protein
MDRITAMISGQPLQISQDVAKHSPLFAAIDDEYLSTGQDEGVQPAGALPIPTFFLAFCQLHIILGDVLANFQEGRSEGRLFIDVNHVIEVDNSLDRFSKNLPSHLRFERDDQNNSSHTGPMVHLQARFLHVRIMLYRVFFLHAAEKLKGSDSMPSTLFADAVTHQGLLTCVRAAQDILQLISSRLVAGDRGPRHVPQWWHIVTYVYTAVTILIAAHIFPTVVEEMTASSLVSSIALGFQILDHHSDYKKSAQRCKMALAVLCERHVGPANEPPNKRPDGVSDSVDTWYQATDQIDAAQISADFGWDFTDPSDLFRGDGMESLLFNTNLFPQENSEWL